LRLGEDEHVKIRLARKNVKILGWAIRNMTMTRPTKY
jgi:hypothetical protein